VNTEIATVARAVTKAGNQASMVGTSKEWEMGC
jgi:hypothetical protein